MKKILVLNAGSSSLKFSLFNKKNLQEFFAGNIERIGLKDSLISYRKGKIKKVLTIHENIPNHQKALEAAIGFLEWSNFNIADIDLVGHRVVHGGGDFLSSVVLNRKVIRQISKNNDLAPIHNLINLAVIKASMKLLPKVKNVASFDTEWYSDMEPVHYLYSLPWKYYTKYKIRKYGFHGLSHEYIAFKAAKKLKRPLNKLNLITCHLGSGASITAVRQGRAIENSMGFTPLSGLLMSSRVGNIDANVPLHMIKKLKISPGRVYEILNYESGWLALAGVKDFRQVMVDSGYPIKGFKSRKEKIDRDKSKLVLNKFLNEVRFYIGGYVGLLGRVDALVFTGGIGERNAHFRKLVVKGLNLKVKVLEIPTNEELMIAKKIKNK